nr:hypothetical protein [Armatimonadota bacterium]
MNELSVFDRSVKVLFRNTPDAICRLLDMDVSPGDIRTDDVSVNVPELRADGLLVLGSPAHPPERGLYLEFQLDYPKRKTVEGWFAKVANLNYQRPYPVSLSVIYLTRGGRKRFPSSYTIHGAVKNTFTFHVIRLWEYIDRIRHGDLKALAPLLVLCENHPTVETLWEEREIIRGLDVDERQRSELFALSIMVGRKYFTEDILQAVFGEEIPMIKELSFIEEWI